MSAAAALAVWVVATQFFGVELLATEGPGSTALHPVAGGAVLTMSLAAPLLGWAFLEVLEQIPRVVRRPRAVWTSTAVLILLVSYGGALFGAGVPASSRAVLGLLHTVVGLVTIFALAPTAPRRY